MTTLPTTLIQFPEIKLPVSAAHQLRGYFGNLFREKSPLLHNHYEDGRVMYRYPLVQYKVVDSTPTLLGLAEGANLLVDLFLKINELRIGGITYPVLHKHIQAGQARVGVVPDELFAYEFKTLWMALNQKNHSAYLNLNDAEKSVFLSKSILQANLLAFCSGIGHYEKNRIVAHAQLTEKKTKFKDQEMLAFAGGFVTNINLPDFAGIGKSVSRGFGTVRRKP